MFVVYFQVRTDSPPFEWRANLPVKVQLTEVPLRQLMFTGVERERENERPSRIALFRRRAFFLLSLGGGGEGGHLVFLSLLSVILSHAALRNRSSVWLTRALLPPCCLCACGGGHSVTLDLLPLLSRVMIGQAGIPPDGKGWEGEGRYINTGWMGGAAGVILVIFVIIRCR